MAGKVMEDWDFRKINSWRLSVWDEDGNEFYLMNIPNWLAQEIDDWLTEIEGEEE